MKKLMGMFLILAMLAGTCTMVPAAENGIDSLLQEAEVFLEAFHLVSNAADNSAQVTRAEFAGAVANVMERANQFYEIDNVIRISDVTEEDANYRAISFLASIGYMKGEMEAPGVYRFRPDDPVTHLEALKVMVDVLGYSNVVQAYGGYPIGYVDVANRAGILKGMSSDAEKSMTWADVKKLVFRSMNAAVAELTGVNGTTVTIEADRNNSYLRKYWNLEKVEGIVTANSLIDLYGQEPMSGTQSNIRIDDDVYTTAYTAQAMNYLGQRVRAYVDRSVTAQENEIVCLYPVPGKNETLRVQSRDILSRNGLRSIRAEVNGRAETLQMADDGAVFVGFEYLGPVRSINPQSFDVKEALKALEKNNCEVLFVDNNQDGSYDLMWIRAYEDYLINNFIFDTFTIADRYNKSVTMERAYKNNKIILTDRDGAVVNPKDLESNQVVSLITKADESGEIQRAFGVVCKESISGAISSLVQDGVQRAVINGTEYEISEEYTALVAANNKKVKKLAVGLDSAFFLNALDQIVGIDFNLLSGGNLVYGFGTVVGRASGLGGPVQMKIVTASGAVESFECASRVKVNGQACTGDQTYETLWKLSQFYSVDGARPNETFILYKMLRYAVSGGKINELEVEIDHAEPDRLYAEKKIRSNDSLSMTRYKSNTIGKQVGVNANTLLLSIPYPAKAQEAVSDDTAFSLINSNEMIPDCVLGIGGLKSAVSGRGEMHFYNLSSTKFAEAAIRYYPYEGGSKVTTEPDPLDDNLIVDKVIRGSNSDGDSVMILKGWRAGVYTTLRTAPIENPEDPWDQLYGVKNMIMERNVDGNLTDWTVKDADGKNVSAITDIRQGDVIHYLLNSKGEVINAIINVRAMEKENAAWLKAGQFSSDHSIAYLGVNYGEIIEWDSSGCTVVLKELDGEERVYALSSATRVTVVNRTTENISMGNVAEFELGNDVYIRQYYGIVKEVVYFK
ncbi:MAG: hypothetical protein HFI90_05280 [Clostridia bacterium]|nr:hypothetical protein [Clostridia bacterium]